MPQMFDVRPVNKSGDLDLEKINSVRRVVKVESKRQTQSEVGKQREIFRDIRKPDFFDDEISRFRRILSEEKKKEKCGPIRPKIEVEEKEESGLANFVPVKLELPPEPEIFFPKLDQEIVDVKEEVAPVSISTWDRDYFERVDNTLIKEKRKSRHGKSWSDAIFADRDWYLVPKFDTKRIFLSFATTSVILLIIVFGMNYAARGLRIKNMALDSGQKAYANLLSAKDGLAGRDYEKAAFEFSLAEAEFQNISNDINTLGGIVVEASKYLPLTSKLSSGAHLAKAGEDISEIGVKVTSTLNTLEQVKNPLATENQNSISLLKIFQDTDNNLKSISTLLLDLEENLDDVNMEDIPENQRDKFVELKKRLPQINDTLAQFLRDNKVFTDILGGNGPRKYLFLFQNNQEMRATGGFVGTYGVLDIFNGQIKNFFIDGIFNPDGQLKIKVVPPAPIQKISAAWSLHDSNWWPDFPKSAEEASWFYEKTGGPTVDGVITMTPTVMQKLLEITGPIEMPEYNVTVDKDNFLREIQYEVEVDYDKELNEPKKILADLAPKILDKIFNTRNAADAAKVMKVLVESLNEKQILLYSKNYEIEKILSERGWSGEVMDTQKDYLSIINTNINGFKTDGVIDEKISHEAAIQNDGSIVDTVTITRQHKGGNTDFEWWNKVNADYMRVYVPKGSKLISATGQTREFDSPPLDYKALGFKIDPQVEMEESQTQIDDQSGTRIYEDSGKTVFANWVYVSPQETVEIKYSYLLPFKIDTNLNTKPADAYSLLAQKQSGSLGSDFISRVTYPKFYHVLWRYPDGKINGPSDLPDDRYEIKIEDSLKTDKFVGMAFSRN